MKPRRPVRMSQLPQQSSKSVLYKTQKILKFQPQGPQQKYGVPCQKMQRRNGGEDTQKLGMSRGVLDSRATARRVWLPPTPLLLPHNRETETRAERGPLSRLELRSQAPPRDSNSEPLEWRWKKNGLVFGKCGRNGGVWRQKAFFAELGNWSCVSRWAATVHAPPLVK